VRCTEIKKNGEQCRAYTFPDGSGLCLFHSQTKKAKLARKIKPTTKIQMIKILEKELKNLDSVEDVITRTAEKRRTIQLICELKGERTPQEEGESENSLETKLKKWRREENKKEKK